MEDDYLPIVWQENRSSIIKVVGVGGGGGNAVNYMYQQGIHNVNFVVCNTDAQALAKSPVPEKIYIGELGAGGDPEKGRKAAQDSLDKIREALDTGTKMVFVTAGMGGGTGTGAAPVIARSAKELGILTVAIVTIPFGFEGPQRRKQALDGIKELIEHVDALLVINNEKLREMYGNLKVSEAFSKADNVLTMAAKGIAELITLPGEVNVDFADVSAIMTEGGITVMGSAAASGTNRARQAVEAALSSPLLNNSDITGARRILLNITSGSDDNEVTMDELVEITDFVTRKAKNASMIWGTAIDESLGDTVSVTVVATDFPNNGFLDPVLQPILEPEIVIIDLPGEEEKIDKVVLNMGDKPTNGTKPTPQKQTHTPTVGKGEYVVREKQVSLQTEIKWPPYPEPAIDVVAEPFEQTRAIPFVVDDKSSIEDLESTSAHPQKKKNSLENNFSGTRREVSKYTLSPDKKENTIRLRSNNSYLYNVVD